MKDKCHGIAVDKRVLMMAC